MTSIEKMSSGDCAKALAELKARQTEIRARVAAIRDPGKSPPPPPDAGATGWRAPNPLDRAGPEYRRIIEAGDARALVKLKAERLELDAEAELLFLRREQLERRLPVAREEEARRVAPKKGVELMGRLPALLDEIDALALALADLIDERSQVLRDLDAARALNEGKPFYEPPLLRRTWASTAPVGSHQLRTNLSTRTEPLEFLVDRLGGGRVVNTGLVADCRRRLAPPDLGFFARFTRQGKIDDESREEIDAVRARLIAESRFDELDDARELALGAVAERHRHSRPGVRHQAVERVKRDSYLTPASHKIADKL